MDERLRVVMTLEQCWHRVPGGTAVAAIGMARGLQRRKNVDLTGIAALHRGSPKEPWMPPVRVRHLPLPRIALYDSWHRFRAPRVELAAGETDVIHATSIAIPPRTAPLVVTVHDLAWLHAPEHFTARGRRFFSRGLELAVKDADLVLCPSTATLEDCREHGFSAERLRVVPLGVESRPVGRAEVQRARDRFGLTRPYILWTGTIEPRKNLDGLLQAYRRLSVDLDLVLVGPKGWNQDLDRLVSSTDGVRALGFVPVQDIDALYAGATVFCFPSLLEGFGFPVLEAMAQGTPVVTSAGTSTEELAGEAAVLVEPRDPESIADGIRRLLDDADLARTLAEAGTKRVARFTWERTAELLCEVYAEVAA